MVTLSFRLRKNQLLAAAAAILLLTAFFWIRGSIPSSKDTPGETVSAGWFQNSRKELPENGDKIAYLQELGWDPEPEPVEILQVVIPREMDDGYQKYNALQKKQGFDLGRFRGKTLRRYTYRLNSGKPEDENFYADLLLYKNTLVGGDIYAPSLEGFMIELTSFSVAEKRLKNDFDPS